MINHSRYKSSETIRWDSFNSKALISQARFIYFQFLSNKSLVLQPKGVVLNIETGIGRVVYGDPVLLPKEHYLPLEFFNHKKKKAIDKLHKF